MYGEDNTSDRGSLDYIDFMKTVVKGKTDPVWFVESETGAELFPMQNRIMSEFYRTKLKQLVIVAGMRSGKSALAGMMGVYELFDLLTINNPAKHYGLLPNQLINISVIATSTTQAHDSIFGNICSMVEGSDWFNSWTDVKVKGEEIRSRDKNVVMRVLSSWSTTAVGRSNKAVIFDELANFEDTNGKRGAWEIWGRLTKSTDTFGNDGKIIAISSPKGPNDIIMTLYKRGLMEKQTMAVLKPTWEMNPNFTMAALKEEHKYNLGMFYRDYACQPQTHASMEFPEGISLNMGMDNILYNMPKHGDDHIRVCAIDPAVTSDAFGIGVGYINEVGRIIVDGSRRFMKEEGDSYIKPSDIKAFLDKVIMRCNANTLVFDTWMFPELIEHVEDTYGMDAVKHIVEKEDYDRWREMQETNEVDVVYDDILKNEADQLVVIESKKSRVDHPFGGSKDMADCVANIIWYLTSDMAENMNNSGVTILSSF